ncbi:MAG: S8 family serine peptidase [Bacteroidota bacterium]|nr:S8 family serine peptidase [Bacteroidota bacterium]
MKHSKKILNYSVLLIALISFSSFDNNNSKLSYQLLQKIRYQDNSEKNLIWIYFTDKGNDFDNKLSTPELFLTEKSIQRRLKRIKNDKLYDELDIPLNANYVNEITNSGLVIKQKSKWFNAISCHANKIQIEIISGKDFVKKIEFVQKYKKSNEPEMNILDNNIPFQSDNTASLNYGPSLVQSNIINVPPVHANGYSGEGVLIASFDAGFDNLQHYCFSLIRAKGLRTYDFVNGDTIVANGEGRLGNDGSHGTLTLSLVGGYSPDSLVSPAYNSQFILAKTENIDSETPLEEDNWIAAAEWADSLGADIITSSLGYVNFDPPYESYTWQSMNGNTTRITQAANIAVNKGIVVVISSGNSGNNPVHNTLNAPADGYNVITVGAVTSARQRAGYSSVGPTTDGRIKPDVMAMGSNNYTAKSGPGSTGYINIATGTSLACPMIAGVCALILSANPGLTPIQVGDILRSTADRSSSPDNLNGWGIVNSLAAVQLAIGSNPNANLPSDYILSQNYPNPFNPSTTFRFTLNKNANISLIIYDESGRMMDMVIDNKSYSTGSQELVYNNGNLSSGVYFYSLIANGVLVDSKKMVLIY